MYKKFSIKHISVSLICLLVVSNFFFIYRFINLEEKYDTYMKSEINKIMSDIRLMENIVNIHLTDLDFSKTNGAVMMNKVVSLTSKLSDEYDSYAFYYNTNIAKQVNATKTYNNFILIKDVLQQYSIIAENYCNKSNYVNNEALKNLIYERRKITKIINVIDISELQDSNSQIINNFNIRSENNQDLLQLIKVSKVLPDFMIQRVSR